MFELDCDNFLLAFDYERDARRPPDRFRRSQFLIGWENAAIRLKGYADKTLQRLTWHNLGYRLGKKFGVKSKREIEEIYCRFAQHYLDVKSKVDETHLIAEEVEENPKFPEGSVSRIIVNAYERNPKARIRCIAKYGLSCAICNFNFEQIYGTVGSGFIHVHHLRQLSEIGEKYEVDPIADLRPVCPNCHAIIHRRKPAFSIEEVKHMLLEAKTNGG